MADAEEAYNALLDEDPAEHRAHLGLADCVVARGLSDWAVDHLVEHARAYAELRQMRGAFALMTKALAIAPGRLDLHIDVAEFEALEGRAEMAALRLENLARTYVTIGQEEEAELVLEAAAAFRAAPALDDEHEHDEDAEDADDVIEALEALTPAPRLAATPPPPPPTSRLAAAPRAIEPSPTPTPTSAMVRPSPLLPPPIPAPAQVLAEPKPKRASRGRASGNAPKWRPSTVTNEPPPRIAKTEQVAEKAAAPRPSLSKPPRPRKAAVPIASDKKERPSLIAAPSPKRGGSKLDKLPPLQGPSLAARLRATSASAGPVGEEDRTSLWRPAT